MRLVNRPIVCIFAGSTSVADMFEAVDHVTIIGHVTAGAVNHVASYNKTAPRLIVLHYAVRHYECVF